MVNLLILHMGVDGLFDLLFSLENLHQNLPNLLKLQWIISLILCGRQYLQNILVGRLVVARMILFFISVTLIMKNDIFSESYSVLREFWYTDSYKGCLFHFFAMGTLQRGRTGLKKGVSGRSDSCYEAPLVQAGHA
jgi:hypothetical protein